LRIKLTPVPAGTNSHPNPHPIEFLPVGTRVKCARFHPYSPAAAHRPPAALHCSSSRSSGSQAKRTVNPPVGIRIGRGLDRPRSSRSLIGDGRRLRRRAREKIRVRGIVGARPSRAVGAQPAPLARNTRKCSGVDSAGRTLLEEKKFWGACHELFFRFRREGISTVSHLGRGQ
jgi:hypothetical protein